MKVQVLYFAYCRDLMGREEESMTLDDNSSVSDVLAYCSAKNPAMDAIKKNLLVAVNQEYARPDQPLLEGDEVAIFPLVSGGSAKAEILREYYAITHERIDTDRIVRSLVHPEDGTLLIFEGMVRNNSRGKMTRYVEYHAYEPMAIKTIRAIGDYIKSHWEVDSVAIVHRLGHLEIGEISVLIAVTSAHRKPAFDACNYAIDVLKTIVPIWKKECFEDGEMWIEGDVRVKPCHEG
jgi:molybdopterin synthase catalytic subunit